MVGSYNISSVDTEVVGVETSFFAFIKPIQPASGPQSCPVNRLRMSNTSLALNEDQLAKMLT